jgi:predicted phosphodiesterase
MDSTRREFLRNLAVGSAWLVAGGIQPLAASEVFERRSRVKLRIALASDGHYGQVGTDYQGFFRTVVEQINAFHKKSRLDACIVNGDIIHDDASAMPNAKKALDGLSMPMYPARGNHDKVTDDFWEQVWGFPLDYSFELKGVGIVVADTSNEKGDYLCPDLVWLKSELEKYKAKEEVFLVLHIPQARWTPNGIDSPGFFKLINSFPNLKAVFHGHEHDRDGVFMPKDVPFFFDSHFGGNWGTSYRGFRVVELLDDSSFITYIMNPKQRYKEMVFDR